MRKALRSSIPVLLLFGFFSMLAFTARAQDEDPPSRVARLNYMEGAVSYQVQGDTDWVAADTNRPLTTGDNLWADKDSRGEVHIDSTAIRLSSETGLSFLNLDDRTVQLQLPQGRIEVHLRQLSPGDAFEIDTPNLAFTLAREGEYVISTSPDGNSTTITVREGEGQVTGGGDSWDLNDGQQYTFDGTDQLTQSAQPAPDFDDFEAWCQTRDQKENNSASAQYVSRDVDGYYDLDQYGEWSEEPDYGQVWYPSGVAVDWVPYHEGHWVYIAPWGWTWVDAEPWGFAPFHYGRWVLVGARWGWVPGPRVVRPVYAPALVGFVGGAGFGLSVSFGGGFTGVAWFPLGPRDVFVPAYRCSPRYVQYVNVTNTRVVKVTEVTNVYNTVIVNRDVTRVNYTYGGNVRAVTAVSRDTFVNARPVGRENVRINDDQFRNVRVVSNTSIAPTRTSYIGANAKIATSRPAVAFSDRPVVARLTPRAPVQVHQAPAMSGRGTQNNGQNSGFRSFGNQDNNRGPAPSGNTASRTLNEQNSPNRGGSNSQPNNQPTRDNGFKSFNPPNNGSRGAAPSNNNSAQPQPNNQQRYRYTPPVNAKDNNYDVHPPLNQSRQQSQPREQHQSEQRQPEQKQSKSSSSPRDNKNH